MKKLLGILVLSLLIVACDNMGSSKTTFKDCYTHPFKSMKAEGLFEENNFEINTENKTVVRTFTWTDREIKNLEKVDNYKIKKINQKTLEIKSISQKYISSMETDRDSEWIFNLKNKIIQVSIQTPSGTAQSKWFCK